MDYKLISDNEFSTRRCLNRHVYAKEMGMLRKIFPKYLIDFYIGEWWFNPDTFERANTYMVRIRHNNKKLEKRVFVCKCDDDWYYVKSGEGKRVKYWFMDIEYIEFRVINGGKISDGFYSYSVDEYNSSLIEYRDKQINKII